MYSLTLWGNFIFVERKSGDKLCKNCSWVLWLYLDK